jgi:hypothetical protein
MYKDAFPPLPPISSIDRPRVYSYIFRLGDWGETGAEVIRSVREILRNNKFSTDVGHDDDSMEYLFYRTMRPLDEPAENPVIDELRKIPGIVEIVRLPDAKTGTTCEGTTGIGGYQQD